MDSICIGKDIHHMRYIQEKNVIAQRRIQSSAPNLRFTSMHRLEVRIVFNVRRLQGTLARF